MILIRDASVAMPQYIGKAGHRPRPAYLPGFVRAEPPHVGLLAAAKDQPLPEGFRIDPDQGGLIRDRAGNCFYGGFELVGAYRTTDGADIYSEHLRHEINLRLGEDLIQSGPYDSLASLDGSRAARPPVTAFLPNHAPVRLETAGEMKGVYDAFKIGWEFTYPSNAMMDVPQ
jgi:hypothetical protein